MLLDEFSDGSFDVFNLASKYSSSNDLSACSSLDRSMPTEDAVDLSMGQAGECATSAVQAPSCPEGTSCSKYVHDFDGVFYQTTRINVDVSGYECYAVTFTLPDTTKYKVRERVFDKGLRTMVNTMVSYPLIDFSPLDQWGYMTNLMDEFFDRLRKKYNKNAYNGFFYPELTAKGLIHAHGYFYLNTGGWTEGWAFRLSELWCKVSGAQMKSMKKKNALGKDDYAIGKCSDIEKWKKYITKYQLFHKKKL